MCLFECECLVHFPRAKLPPSPSKLCPLRPNRFYSFRNRYNCVSTLVVADSRCWCRSCRHMSLPAPPPLIGCLCRSCHLIMPDDRLMYIDVVNEPPVIGLGGEVHSSGHRTDGLLVKAIKSTSA
ncbi:hypothetical protein J6590_088696 [Homalodisca vitripennis]|nr:hypothetical protein J6590_088696 [Homalodisca vitripennis]